MITAVGAECHCCINTPSTVLQLLHTARDHGPMAKQGMKHTLQLGLQQTACRALSIYVSAKCSVCSVRCIVVYILYCEAWQVTVLVRLPFRSDFQLRQARFLQVSS